MDENNEAASYKAEFRRLRSMQAEQLESFVAKLEAFAEDNGLDAEAVKMFVLGN